MLSLHNCSTTRHVTVLLIWLQAAMSAHVLFKAALYSSQANKIISSKQQQQQKDCDRMQLTTKNLHPLCVAVYVSNNMQKP